MALPEYDGSRIADIVATMVLLTNFCQAITLMAVSYQ